MTICKKIGVATTYFSIIPKFAFILEFEFKEWYDWYDCSNRINGIKNALHMVSLIGVKKSLMVVSKFFISFFAILSLDETNTNRL